MPELDASFADELQWLALERPNTLAAVQYLVKGIIARHRPPAMLVTLSGRLEYCDIAVTDRRALLAPVEGRIGRRMRDVIPSALMDDFDRTLRTARKTKRPILHTYPGLCGGKWTGRIHAPSPDLVICTITERTPNEQI